MWDVGGQERIRPLWNYYFNGVNAIIFVIDSNDKERIDEAKEELWRLLVDDQLKILLSSSECAMISLPELIKEEISLVMVLFSRRSRNFRRSL